MTPKEKANYLVNEMYNVDANDDDDEYSMKYTHAISCALIAVDEMLNNFLSNKTTKYGRERYYFWQQVKQEIEKL